MADKKSKKRKLVLNESSGGVILNENLSESIPLYLEIIDEKQIFSYKVKYNIFGKNRLFTFLDLPGSIHASC